MAQDTRSTELDGIIRSAHSAHESARFVTPAERACWLRAIARSLDDAAEELVAIAQSETHLPEVRLTGELSRTTFQLLLLAEEVASGEHLNVTIDHADPAWGAGPRPDLRRVNVPLGVVGIFGASNFPFAFSVMGGDTASALAAGCAVIHKVHGAHEQLGTRTAEIAAAALRETSAPDGLFAIVTGQDAGTALVDHPLVRAIGFTGSTRVGRMLYHRAVTRPDPIPFYGELGSLNPVFVTERAWSVRRDQILAGYAASLTLGMGQFCTKPGLLLVPDMDSQAISVLREALATSPRFPMLSEVLAQTFEESVQEVTAATGVETVVQGRTDHALTPTILAVDAPYVRRNPAPFMTEMFGPAGLVIRSGSDANLAELATLFEGQLTATIHGEDEDQLADLVAALESRAGRLVWNGWPTGVSVSYAQQHGGPYPATTAAGTTSVGTAAIGRFLRPVAYQGFPDSALPESLSETNPWGVARRVDGRWESTLHALSESRP